MGGHGFSAAGGIGRIWAQYLPSVTFEGDNFVLDHQVVRAAIKAHARVSQTDSKARSGSLSPSSAYLRLLNASPPTFGNIEEWCDVRKLAMLLEMRAARVVAARAGGDVDVDDPGAAARVSNAVAAAFVGVHVADMAEALSASGLGTREQVAITRLYVLVRPIPSSHPIPYSFQCDSFYNLSSRVAWATCTSLGCSEVKRRGAP